MNRISSKDNSLIKHINKLTKSTKYRREFSQFVAEGARLCEDALLSGCIIDSLVVCDSALENFPELIANLASKAHMSYVVSDNLFSRISDTKNPQGILCVIKALDNHALFDKIKCNGKFLALENIQDPSNLGTVLRTAEALGIDAVILTDDCCDIYSPKVVRGSMGAVFRVSYFIVNDIADFLRNNNQIYSYAAVVDTGARNLCDVNFSTPCCVVIGNEGNGLKKSTVGLCDACVTIPMNGRAESLNASVAASIIMWEMIK